MAKLHLDLDELVVTSFGTETRKSGLLEDAGQAFAYTLGDHTCRTCRYSICMETSCC